MELDRQQSWGAPDSRAGERALLIPSDPCLLALFPERNTQVPNTGAVLGPTSRGYSEGGSSTKS